MRWKAASNKSNPRSSKAGGNRSNPTTSDGLYSKATLSPVTNSGPANTTVTATVTEARANSIEVDPQTPSVFKAIFYFLRHGHREHAVPALIKSRKKYAPRHAERDALRSYFPPPPVLPRDLRCLDNNFTMNRLAPRSMGGLMDDSVAYWNEAGPSCIRPLQIYKPQYEDEDDVDCGHRYIHHSCGFEESQVEETYVGKGKGPSTQASRTTTPALSSSSSTSPRTSHPSSSATTPSNNGPCTCICSCRANQQDHFVMKDPSRHLAMQRYALQSSPDAGMYHSKNRSSPHDMRPFKGSARFEIDSRSITPLVSNATRPSISWNSPSSDVDRVEKYSSTKDKNEVKDTAEKEIGLGLDLPRADLSDEVAQDEGSKVTTENYDGMENSTTKVKDFGGHTRVDSKVEMTSAVIL